MNDTFFDRAQERIKASADAAAKLTHEGMEVIVTKDDGTEVRTKTRSLPWQLGHGAWVVQIEFHAGGYDCARVRPVEPEDKGYCSDHTIPALDAIHRVVSDEGIPPSDRVSDLEVMRDEISTHIAELKGVKR